MSPKILIVDDNEMNLKLARVILQAAGYATAEAGDGEGALRMIREDLPDLVLLDIQMPHLNGIEVLQALHAAPRMRGIPVIALTSYAMKGDRERFLRDGFTDYIAKPFERIGLLDAIREALERSRVVAAGGDRIDPPVPGPIRGTNTCPGEGR